MYKAVLPNGEFATRFKKPGEMFDPVVRLIVNRYTIHDRAKSGGNSWWPQALNTLQLPPLDEANRRSIEVEPLKGTETEFQLLLFCLARHYAVLAP